MRIGFALPQVGSAVGPETLVTAAQRAEDLGFDSLWVLDRILWPINPRAPYPIGDGSLPVKYKNVLDPLETLTFAALLPRRIGGLVFVRRPPYTEPDLQPSSGQHIKCGQLARQQDRIVPRKVEDACPERDAACVRGDERQRFQRIQHALVFDR